MFFLFAEFRRNMGTSIFLFNWILKLSSQIWCLLNSKICKPTVVFLFFLMVKYTQQNLPL